MQQINEYVTSESASLSPLEILRSPLVALLGVSAAAAAALAKLDIHSIFDLATSNVLSNASLLVEAANVGSSRVDLQACKLEYSIVSPK